MPDRIKPPNVKTLTESDITNRLLLFRRLQAELEQKRNQIEKSIEVLQEGMAAFAAPRAVEMKQIVATVHAWIDANRNQFERPKSRSLSDGGVPVGKIGLRKAKDTYEYSLTGEELANALRADRFASLTDIVYKPRKGDIQKIVKEGGKLPGVAFRPGGDIPFMEVFRLPELDNDK